MGGRGSSGQCCAWYSRQTLTSKLSSKPPWKEGLLQDIWTENQTHTLWPWEMIHLL